MITRILTALLMRITARLPLRIINDGTRPYLERYYVGALLGWRFYLHRFVGSDPDRGLHDHPWKKARSIILLGWYWEELRTGTRKVRWFNSLQGDTFHRVVLPQELAYPLIEMTWDGRAKWGKRYHCGPNPQPCWTLFFHRIERAKKWGFFEDAEPFGFGPGSLVFRPHNYTREGNQEEWWLTAPTRAELLQQTEK